MGSEAGIQFKLGCVLLSCRQWRATERQQQLCIKTATVTLITHSSNVESVLYSLQSAFYQQNITPSDVDLRLHEGITPGGCSSGEPGTV